MSRPQYPSKAPQPMPGNVRTALAKRELMTAYRDRPQYQQDDYLRWIASAVGPAAKDQRLQQMLEELEKGNAYKGEPWTAPPKPEPVRAAATKTDAPTKTDGKEKLPAAKAAPAKSAPKATTATSKAK